jgi:hypothetical protein
MKSLSKLIHDANKPAIQAKMLLSMMENDIKGKKFQIDVYRRYIGYFENVIHSSTSVIEKDINKPSIHNYYATQLKKIKKIASEMKSLLTSEPDLTLNWIKSTMPAISEFEEKNKQQAINIGNYGTTSPAV